MFFNFDSLICFNPFTAISVLTRDIRERSWTRLSGCTRTSKLSAATANRPTCQSVMAAQTYHTSCGIAAMWIGCQWPKARSASAVRSAGRSQSIVEIKLAVKGFKWQITRFLKKGTVYIMFILNDVRKFFILSESCWWMEMACLIR